MKHDTVMKMAFEQVCGPRVTWIGAKPTYGTAFDISFAMNGKPQVKSIGVTAASPSRQSYEAAATQAGRWASVMAERSDQSEYSKAS
ncbi:MAG: hypothetical protein ACRCZI_00995 [Cetobacterium sp.]